MRVQHLCALLRLSILCLLAATGLLWAQSTEAATCTVTISAAFGNTTQDDTINWSINGTWSGSGGFIVRWRIYQVNSFWTGGNYASVDTEVSYGSSPIVKSPTQSWSTSGILHYNGAARSYVLHDLLFPSSPYCQRFYRIEGDVVRASDYAIVATQTKETGVEVINF